MPHYRRVGELPRSRHVLFTSANCQPCFEELVGEEGFAGTSSLLYHLGVPSNLVDTRDWPLPDLSTSVNHPLRPRHFRLPDLFPPGTGRQNTEQATTGQEGTGPGTGQEKPRQDDTGQDRQGQDNDVVRHRRLVLGNDDVRISYVVAAAPSPLYSNGLGDEIVFIESGTAVVESVFGSLTVGQGDNVVIPRVTIHRWIPLDVAANGPLRAYCVEATGHVAPPARYLTRYGQFLESAPLTERVIRGAEGPLLAPPAEAAAGTPVYVKHGSPADVRGSVVVYDHHPFDVVGWDGQLYPYAFNYRDFSPVTGAVLQPPPTYQILEGASFVVCNFVPRKLEYAPGALTVPYYHSNVDSDEVMFYYAGETAARKGTGIGNASASLHPAAYTHGPTRRAYLESVGAAESTEMAFMVDTFRPLRLGEGALATDAPEYPWTWAGRSTRAAAADG